MRESIYYFNKILHILSFRFYKWFCTQFFYTYLMIEECTRCEDCGRNVHDFHVSDNLWNKVSKENQVLCYDCFCDRCDRKGIRPSMLIISEE